MKNSSMFLTHGINMAAWYTALSFHLWHSTLFSRVSFACEAPQSSKQWYAIKYATKDQGFQNFFHNTDLIVAIIFLTEWGMGGGGLFIASLAIFSLQYPLNPHLQWNQISWSCQHMFAWILLFFNFYQWAFSD